MKQMQHTQRTVIFSGLLALGLIACSGGGDGSKPAPTGNPISLEVSANSVALTVFVNASDGSLLETKTAGDGTGKQTLTFNNVPSGASLTRTYQSTTRRYNATIKQYVTIPLLNLFTIPVTAVDQFRFSTPTGVALVPLTNLYATFSAKPTLTGFSYVNALGYNTIFATDGTLKLKSPLYDYQLQTDGKYSEVFSAFDTKDELLGYVTYPDQTVPVSEGSFDAPTFTVAPADWKTDLNTVSITVNNLEPDTGANYYGQIFGSRKGVNWTFSSKYATVNVASNTATFTDKYMPGFFDGYDYFLGYNGYVAPVGTQPGQPSVYNGLYKWDLSSLPNPTLNAKTDLFPSPSNLGYSETGRPTLTWTYAAPASVKRMFAGVYNQTETSDYLWSFYSIPTTTSSLIVPALPTNLASLDPKGNALKYRFYVAATEYDQVTKSPTGYRYGGAARNFSNDIGPASLRARALNVRQRELRGESNSLDEIKRH